MTITLAQARQQVTSSDYYALGYLNLCAVSYADEGGSASSIAAAIEAAVPTIPTYADDGGSWTLEWGPGITSNRANLLYVASYGTSDGAIFIAVCVRGTDVRAGIRGVLAQLREDLQGGCQYEWPSGSQCVSVPPPTSPLVSRGSMNLLNALTTDAVDANGQTLMDFLPGFLANNSGAPLVVTGHSLGGAATMVLALWLKSQLSSPPTIVPNTFAAPTPGNSAFVSLYEGSFSWCPRWYNTNDLIPFAFADVPGMFNLWNSCSLPAPADATLVMKKIESDIAGLDYEQQSTTWSRAITQSCEPIPIGGKQPSWTSNLLYEHSLTTAYYSAMTTPLFKGVALVDMVKIATNLSFQP